jgi:hypothetical protein
MHVGDPAGYGILQRRTSVDDVDAAVEELDLLGFTVVPSSLGGRDLAALRNAVDRGYGVQAAEGGSDELGAERGILRCPLAADELFLTAATLPVVIEIAKRTLGENLVLLQQNAIINSPNEPQFQSKWHRDLPYQHLVASQKLAVNALLCLDDFTLETGGTLVLPGSHLFEAFPSARFVARHERTVEAKAGSVIMMDALLYHRAGANVSSGLRRGVNHLIGRPMLAQQVDIPRLLGPRFQDDAFLSAYLGYRWNPAGGVAAWRASRK